MRNVKVVGVKGTLSHLIHIFHHQSLSTLSNNISSGTTEPVKPDFFCSLKSPSLFKIIHSNNQDGSLGPVVQN